MFDIHNIDTAWLELIEFRKISFMRLLEQDEVDQISATIFVLRHNLLDTTWSLMDSSGYDGHPSKLCLAVSCRIVKLVKVASWPQIIIDIGHLIYMIGSHQTPDHTERIQSSTARATQPPLRFGPFQRSSLELADI
jgi:hypothetical protein